MLQQGCWVMNKSMGSISVAVQSLVQEAHDILVFSWLWNVLRLSVWYFCAQHCSAQRPLRQEMLVFWWKLGTKGQVCFHRQHHQADDLVRIIRIYYVFKHLLHYLQLTPHHPNWTAVSHKYIFKKQIICLCLMFMCCNQIIFLLGEVSQDFPLHFMSSFCHAQLQIAQLLMR